MDRRQVLLPHSRSLRALTVLVAATVVAFGGSVTQPFGLLEAQASVPPTSKAAPLAAHPADASVDPTSPVHLADTARARIANVKVTDPVGATDGSRVIAAIDAGNSWTGNSWTGNSWTGNSWTGNSWTGNSWTGNSWTGNSWTGDSWSSADS